MRRHNTISGVLEYVEKISDFRSAELVEGLSFKQPSATSGETVSTSEEYYQPPRTCLEKEIPGQTEVGIINGVTDVMREDEVGESLSRKEALKNAPAQKDGFIQVKAVFAGSEER